MKNLYNIMASQSFKHWFVPPLAVAPDFQVRGIGVREQMPPCVINRPAGKEDYLFMFFYDTVQVEDNGHKEFRAPDSFKIWEPGQKQWYGHPEKSWNHSWIHCQGTFVHRVLKTERMPLNRTLSLPDAALAEKALLEIHGELTGFFPPHRTIVKHLFENWVCRMARMLACRDRAENIPPKLLETKQFIEMHFTEKLRLGDLAFRACLSVPHFCSEFKRYFKVSALSYAIGLRLHWASQELRNQNRTISEIAVLAGFSDLFYFSRLFKKHFGVSPRLMRRRWLSPARPGKKNRP